jgi:serine/threonine-protein kinase HipA
VLPVYFEARLVGHIEDKRPGPGFAYATSWIEAAGSFPLSTTMPLRTDPWPIEVATPWFANLLPEERQLEQIARLLRHSPSDVYALLEEIGRETAGAFSIGGPEPVDSAQYRALGEADLADAIARLPERPLLVGEHGTTMSLAGAQSKLAVAVFDGTSYLPMHGAASTHILKPESDWLYASVENELLCMRLAERCKLRVARTSMGRAGSTRYLIVERYDRHILADRKVRRGHQEDFCQALGLYPTQKYETRNGPALADLYGVIDQHARRPAGDRLALLDLVILSCCIGDTDRHGKNYSLMLTDGGPRLAPGYDLMSALAWDGIAKNIAMKIAEKNRAEHLERRHWERFAGQVRLGPAATVRRVAQLGTAIAATVVDLAGQLETEFFASSGADGKALRLFAERIRERANTVAANSQRGPGANAVPEASISDQAGEPE